MQDTRDTYETRARERMAESMRALVDSARASVVRPAERAPWSGSHRGGWSDGASTAVNPYVGGVACYEAGSAPDGAQSRDRANKGWSGAWARRNTTRAGKSERRSVLMGSQRGARRGESNLAMVTIANYI